jgi:hypothetical protein
MRPSSDLVRALFARQSVTKAALSLYRGSALETNDSVPRTQQHDAELIELLTAQLRRAPKAESCQMIVNVAQLLARTPRNRCALLAHSLLAMSAGDFALTLALTPLAPLNPSENLGEPHRLNPLHLCSQNPPTQKHQHRAQCGAPSNRRYLEEKRGNMERRKNHPQAPMAPGPQKGRPSKACLRLVFRGFMLRRCRCACMQGCGHTSA